MEVGSENANASLPPIGIVAGWGKFPIEIARYYRSQGRRIVVVAIRDHADPELEKLANHMAWFGIAKFGKQLRYLKSHGVKEVALAGKLFKDRIFFHGWGWLGHFPDWTCLRALYRSLLSYRSDRKDDTLLGSVVRVIEQFGIRVLPAHEAAPFLLVEEGILSKRSPTLREQLDIEFAWPMASAIGGMDIGQGVTVCDRTILGVEAIEGTDALIERTGSLCPRGGFTLVKVAKPQQDMRFDVPTIGLQTVERLHRAGGRAIAIEANRTILVDREATLRRANELGIAIVAQIHARGVSTIRVSTTQVPEQVAPIPVPAAHMTSEARPTATPAPIVSSTLVVASNNETPQETSLPLSTKRHSTERDTLRLADRLACQLPPVKRRKSA